MEDPTRRSLESATELLRAQHRRSGLGLRLQIVAALALGFGLSAGLLALVVNGLVGRALATERRQDLRALAEATLAAGESLDAAAAGESAATLLGHPEVVGVHFEDHAAGTFRNAGTLETPGALMAERGDRMLHLYPAPASVQGGPAGALSGLVLLYVGVTAAAVLVLTYLLLTRLIIRPIELVTVASERLASGTAAHVPERGAAELVRLAVSFNAMEAALRSEREALRTRLEELEKTTRELRATQRSLVRSAKLASVGRLAAGVAHEIGNPLAAIQGLLELAGDEALTAEERLDFVRRASGETDRIHRTIRELLAFARGDSTAPVEEIQEADLAAVVEDALRLVAPQKDLRAVTVEQDFDEPLPAVRGAPGRLTQVVLNLLLNAADAMGGEGTLRLSLTSSAERGTVSLAVEDSGPGIPEDVLPNLFEPFVTTKPSGEGTGLGLAVSHTIIQELDGELTAENREGGGARFLVCLPVAGPE